MTDNPQHEVDFNRLVKLAGTQGSNDMRRMFYIRALRADNATNLATGIQVIIPDGMNFADAHRYVVGRVAEELVRYFAHECVMACGIKEH